MGKVSLIMIETTYTYAKKVRRKLLSPYEAVTCIIQETGMNEASAGILLGTIIKMLNGELYTWGISAESIKYLLEWILRDFDQDYVKKAIVSVRQHIRYKRNGKAGGYGKLESILHEFEQAQGMKK